jgi:excisionase family DNA binding protein
MTDRGERGSIGPDRVALLTARTVADRLGVTPRTVLRWTRRGELPAIRLPGGALRYDERDLDAWLDERATPRRGVLTATPDAAHRNATPLRSEVLTATDDEED